MRGKYLMASARTFAVKKGVETPRQARGPSSNGKASARTLLKANYSINDYFCTLKLKTTIEPVSNIPEY
jgi:hypothetical protein